MFPTSVTSYQKPSATVAASSKAHPTTLQTAEALEDSAIHNNPCYVIVEQEIYDLRPLEREQDYTLMFNPGQDLYFNFCKFVNINRCAGASADSFAQMLVYDMHKGASHGTCELLTSNDQIPNHFQQISDERQVASLKKKQPNVKEFDTFNAEDGGEEEENPVVGGWPSQPHSKAIELDTKIMDGISLMRHGGTQCVADPDRNMAFVSNIYCNQEAVKGPIRMKRVYANEELGEEEDPCVVTIEMEHVSGCVSYSFVIVLRLVGIMLIGTGFLMLFFNL